jgi:SAM-dependent methyltransferase
MRSARELVPDPLKPPLRRLEASLLALRSGERLRDRSRMPWRRAEPNAALTWGRDLDGHAFVSKATDHGAFANGGTILEIGPGYGRLLASALESGAPFERWIGVDISETNVAHLRERFDDPRAEFVLADAEDFEPPAALDAILSSLTLKHFFPTFEAALRNLASKLNKGGMVVVDLIEGEHLRHFEGDGETFVRWYTRDEVTAIFDRCGLDASFDYVDHDDDPAHRRLLAVGRKR